MCRCANFLLSSGCPVKSNCSRNRCSSRGLIAIVQPRGTRSEPDWERFAPVLNAQLEGKQWVTGNTFTIADIALGTTVEFAGVAGLDVKAYPHLKAWLDRLTSRESWKKAG